MVRDSVYPFPRTYVASLGEGVFFVVWTGTERIPLRLQNYRNRDTLWVGVPRRLLEIRGGRYGGRIRVTFPV